MSPAARAVPRSLWIRVGLLAVLVGVGVLLVKFTPAGELLTRERMIEIVAGVRRSWWGPLALIGLYAVLAPLALPMSPLLVGGAVFGPLSGTAYNTLGLLIGAALSYQLARLLGREFVLHVTAGRLRRAERLFERHGFWPLVQTRFLPLPFPVVNFGAALGGVRPARFLLATVVGIVPSTLIHTVFIARLFATEGRARWVTLSAYAACFVAFNLAIGIPWLRRAARRRGRYRRLSLARAARRGSRPTVPGPNR